MQAKEHMYYQDKLYRINRKIHESKLKPDFNVTVMMRWTGSDIILKKEDWFFCCEEVREAQIISESQRKMVVAPDWEIIRWDIMKIYGMKLQSQLQVKD